MAWHFVDSTSTGSYQTLFSRLIENPDTITLTDTPGVLSLRSVPFDGLNDSFDLSSVIEIDSIGASGTSATNLSFDAWIKPNVTGQVHNTFFDINVLRNASGMTTGYDGFYSGHVFTTGGNRYIDFRIDHDLTYSLTSQNTVALSAWTHIMCQFSSGTQTMQIFIDGQLDREGVIGSASVGLGSALGSREISFGGILDELRLWIATGSASSVGILGSATSIGTSPDFLGINDFTPSSDTMAAWWRLDSVSSFQLFSSVPDSIEDYTTHNLDGTPSGFEGSDVISSEYTIIDGISASGDLKVLLGGTLDHGGLTLVDLNNNEVMLETGTENLIKEQYNTWVATGSGVVILDEDKNIFYGSSSVKVNTTSADTGVYQNVSNSALLYAGNPYTCSFRIRSITGSVSSRVTFTLGTSSNTITAVTNTSNWEPVVLRNVLEGSSLTGNIEIIQLNNGSNAGALFQIDGLQVLEGDQYRSFIAPDRVRKSGQLAWEIYN